MFEIFMEWCYTFSQDLQNGTPNEHLIERLSPTEDAKAKEDFADLNVKSQQLLVV